MSEGGDTGGGGMLWKDRVKEIGRHSNPWSGLWWCCDVKVANCDKKPGGI